MGVMFNLLIFNVILNPLCFHVFLGIPPHAGQSPRIMKTRGDSNFTYKMRGKLKKALKTLEKMMVAQSQGQQIVLHAILIKK